MSKFPTTSQELDTLILKMEQANAPQEEIMTIKGEFARREKSGALEFGEQDSSAGVQKNQPQYDTSGNLITEATGFEVDQAGIPTPEAVQAKTTPKPQAVPQSTRDELVPSKPAKEPSKLSQVWESTKDAYKRGQERLGTGAEMLNEDSSKPYVPGKEEINTDVLGPRSLEKLRADPEYTKNYYETGANAKPEFEAYAAERTLPENLQSGIAKDQGAGMRKAVGATEAALGAAETIFSPFVGAIGAMFSDTTGQLAKNAKNDQYEWYIEKGATPEQAGEAVDADVERAKKVAAEYTEPLKKFVEENPLLKNTIEIGLWLMTGGESEAVVPAAEKKLLSLGNDLLPPGGAGGIKKFASDTSNSVSEYGVRLLDSAKKRVNALEKSRLVANEVKSLNKLAETQKRSPFQALADRTASSNNKIASPDKFSEITGIRHGEWMNRRGITGTTEENIKTLANKFVHDKNMLDEAIAMIPGQHSPEALYPILEESIAWATKVSEGLVNDPALRMLNGIKGKLIKDGGLSSREILAVKRYYESNTKFGYSKDLNPAKVANATKLDDALREDLIGIAESAGFRDMRALSKEIQATKYLTDEMTKKAVKSGQTELIGITDRMLTGMTFVDASAFYGIAASHIASSTQAKSIFIKVLNGLPDRPIKVNLSAIKTRAKEFARNEAAKAKATGVQKAAAAEQAVIADELAKKSIKLGEGFQMVETQPLTRAEQNMLRAVNNKAEAEAVARDIIKSRSEGKALGDGFEMIDVDNTPILNPKVTKGEGIIGENRMPGLVKEDMEEAFQRLQTGQAMRDAELMLPEEAQNVQTLAQANRIIEHNEGILKGVSGDMQKKLGDAITKVEERFLKEGTPQNQVNYEMDQLRRFLKEGDIEQLKKVAANEPEVMSVFGETPTAPQGGTSLAPKAATGTKIPKKPVKPKEKPKKPPTFKQGAIPSKLAGKSVITKPAEFRKISLLVQTPDKSLTEYSIKELTKFDTRLLSNKKAGYALTPVSGDGKIELVNVFSLEKGNGKIAVVDAIKNAKLKNAKTIVLDAYKRLEGYYEKFGFKTTENLKFDPEIAGFEGGEDIVIMQLNLKK